MCECVYDNGQWGKGGWLSFFFLLGLRWAWGSFVFLGEWGRGDGRTEQKWSSLELHIHFHLCMACGGMKMAVREGIYTRRMCNAPPWRHPKHSETIGPRRRERDK